MRKIQYFQNDLVVYGATPGGISTAIRAAREGLNVLLVSYSAHIGGMWINGVQLFDTLYEDFRTPLLEEYLNRIRSYYRSKYGEDSVQYRATLFGARSESFAHPCFEPHVAEYIFNEMVNSESGITLEKKYFPLTAEISGRTLNGVHFKHIDSGETICANSKVYIDASYEGDLAAISGVPYRIGREDRNEYGERYAGKIFGRRRTGLFPHEASAEILNLRCFKHTTGQIFPGSTGEGDRAIQSFNARLTLSSDPKNRRSIVKPENYDRNRYLLLLGDINSDVVVRSPLKSQLILEKLSLETVGLKGVSAHSRQGLQSKIYGWNAGNYVGGNYDYPDGDWTIRSVIIKEHIDHALGLLYFLQNDEQVPIDIKMEAKEWGLAKDEYVDNDNVPYEIYVREGRRFLGRYVFTEHDVMIDRGIQRTPIHSDSIAIADWYIDIHDCTTERKCGSENDGLLMLTEESRPAQVPYSMLLPQNIDNLLTTVCVSSSHVGWGAIRTEPTLVHIGEAAGFAAAQAVKNNKQPAEISVKKLQKALIENQVMISFFNDFDMKTEKRWVPAIQYLCTQGFFESFDAKPEAFLNDSTLKIWVEKIGQLLFDKNIRFSANQQSDENEENKDRVISARDFVELIKSRIEQKDVTLCDFTFLDEFYRNENPVCRGDACFILYEMLNKLKYFGNQDFNNKTGRDIVDILSDKEIL